MFPDCSIPCQVGLYIFIVVSLLHCKPYNNVINQICSRSIAYKYMVFRRVQTCSPCKKFYRRNFKRSDLECWSKTFTCTIDAREGLRHPKMCPRCRLAKCFQVGLHEQLQLYEPLVLVENTAQMRNDSDLVLLTGILNLLDAPNVRQNSRLLEIVATAVKQAASMKMQGNDANSLLTGIIMFIVTAAFRG